MTLFKDDIIFDKICAEIAKDFIKSDMLSDFAKEKNEDATGDWLDGKYADELLKRVKFKINQYTEVANT